MFIKICGDFLSEEDKRKFYEIFGDICDSIFIEHTMNCWHGFDMKDVKQNEEFGIYGQPIKEVNICPYVFYSFSINSDGSASACFLDWSRNLLIGDVRKESVKDIWNSEKLGEFQELFLKGKRKSKPLCWSCNQLSYGMPVDLDDKREEIYKRWKR